VIGTESCTELINTQACVNAYAVVCSEAQLTFTVHQGEGEDSLGLPIPNH
jgi:hypothetical protein